MIGRTISHYRVIAPLGAGGMGVVYRAEDVRLGRPVALKFVSEDLASDPQAVSRLRSEARAASALNHGNICTIYDVGEDEGQPFIVMELMKGRALRDHLANGPLKIHQLVDIGIEIADALHAAHSQGIVHRDIKPGNIFLTDLGHVKILDFGLAKLTPRFGESGTTVDQPDRTVAGLTRGTVSYMSPEQATGEDLDGRTDLFSLGVVLYECATGRHPFPGKTSAVILASILNRAPIAPTALNPDLPLRLQDVINNCLEKDRELRYQSAADVRADLKRVRRDIESGHSRSVDVPSASPASAGSGATPAVAPASSPATADASRTASLGGSRAWLAGAVIAVLAVVGGAGSYAWWHRRPSIVPMAGAIDAQSEATIKSRLGLAQSSLDSRNYPAALAYASEVLALDARHTEAARIRDEARAMLARFDSAVTAARQRIAAGDVRGAAQALETARAIDSTSPTVSALSSQLAEQIRQKEQRAADQASQRSRPSVDLPSPPAPRSTLDRPRSEPARDGRSLRAETPTPPVSSPVPPPPTREDKPPVPAAQPAAPTAGSAVPTTVPPEPTAPKAPAPAAAAGAERNERAQPSAPAPADDEAAIRRAIALYARAIEAKDLALFRSIKPNLSPEEERRLRDGFRAVDSQRVDLTILSVDVHGQDASVLLRRRDTIQAGGRQHATESQQTMRLTRTGGRWAIVDIR